MEMMSDGKMPVGFWFWQISESILVETRLPDIFQLIVSAAARLLDFKFCSLMTIDDAKKELHTGAVYGADMYVAGELAGTVKTWEGIPGRAIKDKKPVEVSDVREVERNRLPDIGRIDGLVSLISVPIKIGKNVLGVLNGYTGERHGFTEMEIALLKTLANHAAQAMLNQKLRDENVAVKTELENRKIIEQAEHLLIEKKGLNEEEARRLLRRTGRQYQKPLPEMAKAVILAFSFDEDKARSGLV